MVIWLIWPIFWLISNKVLYRYANSCLLLCAADALRIAITTRLGVQFAG